MKPENMVLIKLGVKLMPRPRLSIFLNFKIKNKAARTNLQANKRILRKRPFWDEVY